jgi:hypothetical protein
MELIPLHRCHFLPVLSCLVGNTVFHIFNHSTVAFAATNVTDFLLNKCGASSGRGDVGSGATSTPC